MIKMINTRKIIIRKQYSDEQLDLLCRKGFYPYEWVDSDDKFNHVGLPDRKEFYSKLTNDTISEKYYERAKNVYDKIIVTPFYDYHMMYLKCDVLLFSDVFATFCETSLSYYKLDPANYISAPSLSCDAMF